MCFHTFMLFPVVALCTSTAIALSLLSLKLLSFITFSVISLTKFPTALTAQDRTCQKQSFICYVSAKIKVMTWINMSENFYFLDLH